MGAYLICANPVQGNVAPMLAAAGHLVERGHRVTVLTGSRFADDALSAGARFRALEGLADYDDRDPALYLPDRERHRGIARAQYQHPDHLREAHPGPAPRRDGRDRRGPAGRRGRRQRVRGSGPAALRDGGAAARRGARGRPPRAVQPRRRPHGHRPAALVDAARTPPQPGHAPARPARALPSDAAPRGSSCSPISGCAPITS